MEIYQIYGGENYKKMLSVIIPTYNRSNLLRETLDSIINQDLNKSEYEVIIINNGSTDDTENVIKNFKKKSSNISSHIQLKQGLHEGRNLGYKVSKGDVLVYCDDDIEAFPTWLSSIKESFEDNQVALVGGNNIPKFVIDPPLWLKKEWENKSLFKNIKIMPQLSLIYYGEIKKDIDPALVWGCNFSVRKKIIKEIGGFNPDGMPIDLIKYRGDGESGVANYIRRNNYKSIFHPGASIYHKVTPERMSIEYFKNRGFGVGISHSYTEIKSPINLINNKVKYSSFIINIIKNIIDFLRQSREAKKIYKTFEINHKQGYEFHQILYQIDPSVKKWVDNINYLK
jgi:glucosyl-dolichyl phosphate glucuronosyltransferase